MGTYLITHITAEGSHEEIDEMLARLRGPKGSVEKSKLEKVTGVVLPFVVSETKHVQFSPYKFQSKGIIQNRQRALILETNWHSKEFDESLMYALSASFPLIVWKIYTDDYQECATCEVFEFGLKSYSVALAGQHYYDFVKLDEADFEVDGDGLRNKLDVMIFKKQGKLIVADSVLKKILRKPEIKHSLPFFKERDSVKISIQLLVARALSNVSVEADAYDLLDEINHHLKYIAPQIDLGIEILDKQSM